MAKKNKKVQEPEVEVSLVATEPVAGPIADAVVAEEVKKFMVNCYRCGAALHVQADDVVYMCPVCNNLFRVRIGEKLVKDVSQVAAKEVYVDNVRKKAE